MKHAGAYHSFYTKTMAWFVILLCSISILLSLFINNVLGKYEKANYIKEYDIVMNDLHRIFNSRCRYFYNTLEPLFQNTSDYNNLNTLCKTADSDTLDAATTSELVDVFYDICKRDFNCIGILLYSNITKRLFLFDLQYQTIEPLDLEADFPEYAPYTLQFMSEESITSLNPRFSTLSDHLYGLSGTVYNQDNTALFSLGQIVILYSSADLMGSISEQYLSEDSFFSIEDNVGNVIFHSSDAHQSQPLFQTISDLPETAQTITVSGEEAKTEEGNIYRSYIYNGRYQYLVTYSLPRNGTGFGYSQLLITLLIGCICLFSISLFIFTSRMSSKKVMVIREGMRKIGGNALDYRIPSIGQNDEFTAIIDGFNHMCDELQENVEKSYVYVLQQQTAELYALQTSINPHFLYNTLDLIRVQITQNKPQDASQMILLLSGIYRNQMRRNFFVSLSEELEQCEKLIELYMFRYGNFEYEFDIDNSLLPFALPKNTLHPLIENYFVHGIDPTREDNLIKLTGKREEKDGISYIRLNLRNNGQSISPEELAALNEKLDSSVLENSESSGFALPNVHNRLRIVFGKPCGLYPESNPDSKGFSISILYIAMLPSELTKLHQLK